MAVLKFDELNKLYTNANAVIHSVPYEKYFDVMDISDEQKEKRIEVARKLEGAFLFLFSLIDTTILYDYYDLQFIIEQCRRELLDIIGEYTVIDAYINQYVNFMSEIIVRNTYDKLSEQPDNEYVLSDDRAVFMAENEANSICNYDELQEAIEQGFTMKTWVTQGDNRVRRDHSEVDGMTIPIDEYFEVGDSLMLYPHDEVNAPEQCVNCRCSALYS